MKRDLQRWLRKTHISKRLSQPQPQSPRGRRSDSQTVSVSLFSLLPCICSELRRVVTALDDVLGSQESPLEVKDPMALDFLPSTLIEQLRVVKTGETLADHPFYSLLMDESCL